jgi:hypothetical protein
VWSVPTIGAALTAGYPWLSIYCPGCRSIQEIDLRKVDRHPDAVVTRLVLSLRGRMCGNHAPMPELRGLAQAKSNPTRKASDVA